jgi:thiol-disulfide isomerase/thioredoxin
MKTVLIRFRRAAHVFLGLACVSAILFTNGCSSEKGAGETGKTKYEVAGADDANEDAAPASESAPGTLGSSFTPPGSPAADGQPSSRPDSRAGGMPTAGGAPPQPPSTPPSDLNPYRVEGETPQELMAFIERMMQTAQRPPGVTRAEQISSLQNIFTSVVEAAEKILVQDAESDTLRMAAEAKVACLTQLAALRVGDASQQLSEFCTELAASDNADLAQLGQRMQFAQAMDAFARGDSDDATGLVADFKELLAGEKTDQNTLEFARSVAGLFEQRGFESEAVQVIKFIETTFADVTDIPLATEVARLGENGLLIELGLREKLNAYTMGQQDALETLLSDIDTLLQSERRGEVTLDAALRVGMYLEQNDPQKATELYQQLVEAFKDRSQLGEAAAEAADKYAKRSSIVGQPFVVEGVLPDGSPFDWSRYAGKVVLVDFWATWCMPCIQEIPNIREHLNRYQDQGFEVVGVNLDNEQTRLADWLASQPLPWPTVVSADAEAVGFQAPMAAKYGVNAIPFLVLVDRDGTAIALNLRGDKLSAKLAEMFAEKPPAP